MYRQFPVAAIAVAACLCPIPAQAQGRLIVGDDSLEASKSNRIVLENWLDGAAGKVIKLPAGVIHLDRALTLKPEHSGVTIEGAGPGTFLRNSHHTSTYPANSSFVAMGTGVGYADQLTEPPNGARLSFVDNVDLDHYPVGGLLYAYLFDGYTKAGVGQLTARRRVVRRVGLRAIEIDRPIDPRCNSIKWVDGEPLTSAKEGDRVLALAHDADPTRFVVGSSVYVTDGPIAANEVRGEHRTLTGIDPHTKTVMLDRPLRLSYKEAALLRLKVIRDVTLRNLTIAQPPQKDATPTCIKYCTGWRIEGVHTQGRMGACTCYRFQIRNCEFSGLSEYNTCQDIAISNCLLAGVYYEEVCLDNSVTDCRVFNSSINGVMTNVDCERLHLNRVRIKDSAVMPIAIDGRENVVESVVVEQSSKTGASYVQGDRLRVTDLSSNVLLIFRNGRNQVINGVRAAEVMFGDPTNHSPSSGEARDIHAPKIELKSKDWTVSPSLAGVNPPR